MIVTRTSLSLCEDCIVTLAYGSPWEDSRPDAEPLTRLDLRDPVTNDPECHEGECEGHFDRRCDGCETQWAGNRYCHIQLKTLHAEDCPCGQPNVHCFNPRGWCEECTCYTPEDEA